MKLPHWMPSFNFVAQAAHFGWGVLVVLVWAHYAGNAYGAPAIMAYATVKEFVFDKYIERQTFFDNLQDWIYWLAGTAAGVLVLFT